jgi:hypothetical protein
MDQSIWRIDEGGLPGCPVGTVIAIVQEGDSVRVIREGVGQIGTLYASTTQQTSTLDGSSITLVNQTEGWRAVLSRTTASAAPAPLAFCTQCGAALPPGPSSARPAVRE